jgi:hypothetical protein
VLNEPFSSSGPHLEGHHFSGQNTSPKADDVKMPNTNAPTKKIAKQLDFFMSTSFLWVIRVRVIERKRVIKIEIVSRSNVDGI